jgi:hypothetical protein
MSGVTSIANYNFQEDLALALQEEANLNAALARSRVVIEAIIELKQKLTANEELISEVAKGFIANQYPFWMAAIAELFASNPQDERLHPFTETNTKEYVDENGVTTTKVTIDLKLNSTY